MKNVRIILQTQDKITVSLLEIGDAFVSTEILVYIQKLKIVYLGALEALVLEFALLCKPEADGQFVEMASPIVLVLWSKVAFLKVFWVIDLLLLVSVLSAEELVLSVGVIAKPSEVIAHYFLVIGVPQEEIEVENLDTVI